MMVNMKFKKDGIDPSGSFARSTVEKSAIKLQCLLFPGCSVADVSKSCLHLVKNREEGKFFGGIEMFDKVMAIDLEGDGQGAIGQFFLAFGPRTYEIVGVLVLFNGLAVFSWVVGEVEVCQVFGHFACARIFLSSGQGLSIQSKIEFGFSHAPTDPFII
jgi:hypothetical protein